MKEFVRRRYQVGVPNDEVFYYFEKNIKIRFGSIRKQRMTVTFTGILDLMCRQFAIYVHILSTWFAHSAVLKS